MGFGNSAQTAERRWGPPRPLQGSALSSPWTLASKVTNPRGLGRRLGPIRQVRRDCLGGAKPHFPPDFEHLIPTRQTLHRSYAVAQNRCLCAEIPRVPVGRRTIGPSALSLTFVAAERANPRTLNWRPLLFQYLHAIRSKQHNLSESCVRE
jgi:hypothetical protein